VHTPPSLLPLLRGPTISSRHRDRFTCRPRRPPPWRRTLSSPHTPRASTHSSSSTPLLRHPLSSRRRERPPRPASTKKNDREKAPLADPPVVQHRLLLLAYVVQHLPPFRPPNPPSSLVPSSLRLLPPSHWFLPRTSVLPFLASVSDPPAPSPLIRRPHDPPAYPCHPTKPALVYDADVPPIMPRVHYASSPCMPAGVVSSSLSVSFMYSARGVGLWWRVACSSRVSCAIDGVPTYSKLITVYSRTGYDATIPSCAPPTSVDVIAAKHAFSAYIARGYEPLRGRSAEARRCPNGRLSPGAARNVPLS
jgi:hypothetical protein